MSSEQATQETLNNLKTKNLLEDKKNYERVDYNNLMSKIRKEEKKQFLKNLISFSFVFLLIIVFGTILSL